MDTRVSIGRSERRKTVISVRESLERTGEISQLKKTVGKEGKARKKPLDDVSRKSKHLNELVNTGNAASDSARQAVLTRARRHSHLLPVWGADKAAA